MQRSGHEAVFKKLQTPILKLQNYKGRKTPRNFRTHLAVGAVLCQEIIPALSRNTKKSPEGLQRFGSSRIGRTGFEPPCPCGRGSLSPLRYHCTMREDTWKASASPPGAPHS